MLNKLWPGTIKTKQIIGSVHTTPKQFENATITGRFGFVVEENSVRRNTLFSWSHRFWKTPFSKCFRSTLNRNAGVFKYLRFRELFQRAKLRFRVDAGLLCVDGWPNRRNKVAFSNFRDALYVVQCGRYVKGIDDKLTHEPKQHDALWTFLLLQCGLLSLTIVKSKEGRLLRNF